MNKKKNVDLFSSHGFNEQIQNIRLAEQIQNKKKLADRPKQELKRVSVKEIKHVTLLEI